MSNAYAFLGWEPDDRELAQLGTMAAPLSIETAFRLAIEADKHTATHVHLVRVISFATGAP